MALNFKKNLRVILKSGVKVEGLIEEQLIPDIKDSVIHANITNKVEFPVIIRGNSGNVEINESDVERYEVYYTI